MKMAISLELHACYSTELATWPERSNERVLPLEVHTAMPSSVEPWFKESVKRPARGRRLVRRLQTVCNGGAFGTQRKHDGVLNRGTSGTSFEPVTPFPRPHYVRFAWLRQASGFEIAQYI